jgi:hypothetical protein
MIVKRNIEAVLADLPQFAAARLPSDDTPVLIMRGERGYWPWPPGIDPDAFNKQRGISAAQVEAMVCGSMFGFEVPGADPLNYLLHLEPVGQG